MNTKVLELLLFCILNIYNATASGGSNGIKLLIHKPGPKHRTNEVYIIPGAGCKGPTIIKKGRHKLYAKGKILIIIQEDCHKKEDKKEVEYKQADTEHIYPPVQSHQQEYSMPSYGSHVESAMSTQQQPMIATAEEHIPEIQYDMGHEPEHLSNSYESQSLPTDAYHS